MSGRVGCLIEMDEGDYVYQEKLMFMDVRLSRFYSTERTDIGRKSSILEGVFTFGKGIILAVFHSLGNVCESLLHINNPTSPIPGTEPRHQLALLHSSPLNLPRHIRQLKNWFQIAWHWMRVKTGTLAGY